MNSEELCRKLRHDLKNHLSVVRLYAELLSMHLAKTKNRDEKAAEYIKIILKRSEDIEQDLKKLTPELLDPAQGPEAYSQTPEST